MSVGVFAATSRKRTGNFATDFHQKPERKEGKMSIRLGMNFERIWKPKGNKIKNSQ
jgi:hypothetical protein